MTVLECGERWRALSGLILFKWSHRTIHPQWWEVDSSLRLSFLITEAYWSSLHIQWDKIGSYLRHCIVQLCICERALGHKHQRIVLFLRTVLQISISLPWVMHLSHPDGRWELWREFDPSSKPFGKEGGHLPYLGSSYCTWALDERDCPCPNPPTMPHLLPTWKGGA